MRKIIIELQVDWNNYDDVCDELVVEDAIEARMDGVSWTLLPGMPIGVDCEHPYASVVGDGENKPVSCLKCGKILE